MKTQTINNKEYQVLARYSAIKMFCDKKGIDFFEFPDLLMSYGIEKKDFKPTTKFVDDMSLIMLCFLERGAEASNTVCDLTLNDILDWFLDGNVLKVYDLIIEAQGQSKNVIATEKE
jgi:hypothetical protein